MTRFLVISRRLVKIVKTGTKVKQLTIQITFSLYRLQKRKERQLILFTFVHFFQLNRGNRKKVIHTKGEK